MSKSNELDFLLLPVLKHKGPERLPRASAIVKSVMMLSFASGYRAFVDGCRDWLYLIHDGALHALSLSPYRPTLLLPHHAGFSSARQQVMSADALRGAWRRRGVRTGEESREILVAQSASFQAGPSLGGSGGGLSQRKIFQNLGFQLRSLFELGDHKL